MCGGGNDTAHHSPALKGLIEAVIYKGKTVDLIVRLPSGKKIHASTSIDEEDPALKHQLNECVWVNWPEGRCRVLPNEK